MTDDGGMLGGRKAHPEKQTKVETNTGFVEEKTYFSTVHFLMIHFHILCQSTRVYTMNIKVVTVVYSIQLD